MAKHLREEQPASSVSRILELSNAARGVMSRPAPVATLASEPQTTPAPTTTTVTGKASDAGKPDVIVRDLSLTPQADRTFGRLLEAFRHGTGTRMAASTMFRGVLRGIEHCFEEVEREARRLGRLKLPSNARGKESEREHFEARIADAFVTGMRNASAFTDQTGEATHGQSTRK